MMEYFNILILVLIILEYNCVGRGIYEKSQGGWKFNYLLL